MDKELTLLEKQLRRLYAGQPAIDPVPGLCGVPISFQEWCQDLIIGRGRENCPNEVSTLVGLGILDKPSIAQVVRAMEVGFAQLPPQVHAIERKSIVEEVIHALRRPSSIFDY